MSQSAILRKHFMSKEDEERSKIDNFLIIREKLRNFVEKYSTTDDESVYDAAVRYGRLAYDVYCYSLNLNGVSFENLSNEEQVAWIEVGTQIERITLKENT